MLSETIFALLDAAVQRDRGPPGFTGRIAIGVVGRRTDWWIADVGAKVEARRANTTPPDCATVLILGEDEALRMVSSESFPDHPRMFQTFGDTVLLGRFRERYLSSKNLLELRVSNKRGDS